ncbi:MAG: ComEC/Rec2 family competence protein [Muribaculaceae bacterium]|nr:ComEC/Rec2 family competence protein [Muribaculaceae bacterium]
MSKWHFIWILFLFLGIGSLDYHFRSSPSYPFNLDGVRAIYSGTIDEISYLSDGDRFKVKITSIQDSNHITSCSNLNFLVKTDGFVGSKGDKISFSATPHKFKIKKPGVDYEKKMIHQGIHYYANVQAANITKTGETKNLFRIFTDWRNNLIIILEKSKLERETSEFLISLLLGDKSFLSSDVKQALNSAGMAHVLALSGMHVAIILSLVLWVLFPLSLIGYHKTRQIIAILIIWIYVLLTGSSPSTIRAAIMASLVIGAYILERKNSALNALLAATLIILIAEPLALWNVGLQLSFLCVASIILYVNKLNPIERHTHPKLYGLTNLILITIITSVCTWVLVSYYFGSVPVSFLLSNTLLLPFLPLFVGSGLIYLFLLIIGIDWNILAKFLDFFNSIFIEGIEFLTWKGGAMINVQAPLISTLLWIFGILSIGYLLNIANKKYKIFGFTFSALTLLCSFLLILLSPGGNDSKIKFQHSFTKLEVHHSDNEDVTKLEFPRNGISKSKFRDLNILTIDNYIHKDSVKSLIPTELSKTHFLFVGSGADPRQIAELVNSSNYSKIILHTTMGKNKKAELLNLVNESELDKIYSLRENGSLEFDL